MIKTLSTRGLTAGSLFKLLLAGNFVSAIFLFLAIGLYSIFAPNSMAPGEVTSASFGLHGVLGALVALLLSPLYAVFSTLAQWIFVGVGVWIWTRFKHLSLSFHEHNPQQKTP